MIEFRLNERSGVPTYLQLVQQVRQAVRLGMLQPGDQLPTVKEVVGMLAINPNTVLKAYRELDHEGLVEGRRGQGTFVSRDAQADASHGLLSLARGAPSLDRAGTCCRAGRGRHRRTRRSDRPVCVRQGGGRMSEQPVVETSALGKRYGSLWALRECYARHTRRVGRRPRRAKRSGKDDAPAPARRAQ